MKKLKKPVHTTIGKLARTFPNAKGIKLYLTTDYHWELDKNHPCTVIDQDRSGIPICVTGTKLKGGPSMQWWISDHKTILVTHAPSEFRI